MNVEINTQLNGLTAANREKEAVGDYIQDNLTSFDDFAEIQSVYQVFFCGVAGANPMPLRQQQRYASQRIMQASLATLTPPTAALVKRPPAINAHHQRLRAPLSPRLLQAICKVQGAASITFPDDLWPVSEQRRPFDTGKPKVRAGEKLYWDAVTNRPYLDIESGDPPASVFEVGIILSVGFQDVLVCLSARGGQEVELY
ncbi:MAG: hypothetical protein ACPGR8_14390 [Limisphaerales bacterium]